MFFFEKRLSPPCGNQKTFIRCRGPTIITYQKIKVFCFFFSKKKTFLSSFISRSQG
jgi:hypothetical protein